MIIDFHIHYTPPALAKEKLPPGVKTRITYSQGIPIYIDHPILYSLETHVAAMDMAGVDVAVLSSGAGMLGTLEVCTRLNDILRAEEKRFPGRILGLAHIPPLGGLGAIDELKRAAQELGFKGVAICSSYSEVGLDSPDLFPALAVVAAAAKGKTRLTGAPHLRLKESDRIAAVARMLAAMGVGVRELPDGLEVEGGRLRGAVVDPGGDHRIAMAAAVAGLAAEGTTTVLGAECVRVSYPAFFEHLRRLGALVEVSA